MFSTEHQTIEHLDISEYRDKVLGCWTGKNIGGTLGGPFEWDQNINHVTFYSQELDGKPAPNDDLDLQLIWLKAAEEKGIYHLNERVLGEYWLNYITGPWNEYGICKSNMRNGLVPPLSGSCNNDKWKNSNGAWIRSEIWACIFPGSPDEAARFAYYDSCCDHSDEGIYAEVFTAVIQSAAFVIKDIRKLIELGLSRIPEDCRIARSVRLVCEQYDKGNDFFTTREAVVEDSKDLGWFQAPGNIGFVIIGLLYGRGDFGKSVCLATNCGDDTDCTAGTVGALLGIINGRSAIPEKWIKPIGESIRTCSVCTYSSGDYMGLPKTLDELTDRVMRIAFSARYDNADLPRLENLANSQTEEKLLEKLSDNQKVIKTIWSKSPYEIGFDLPFGVFYVDYEQGPYVVSGEPQKLRLKIGNVPAIEQVAAVKLLLPEGWKAFPADECSFMIQCPNVSGVELTIVPGEFSGAYYYLPAEIRLSGRLNPFIVYIPLQKRGSVDHTLPEECQDYYEKYARCKSWKTAIES